jgi:hypothetical protein
VLLAACAVGRHVRVTHRSEDFMKVPFAFIAASCIASTCSAATQLVKEEDGLRRDWLDAIHANWAESSVICLAGRPKDLFVRAYVLPATVTLDELGRIDMNVDFDALQKLSDIAFAYDRVANKSRLSVSKSALQLPAQLQTASPGRGVVPTQDEDKKCRERPGFSVGPRHDGQLRSLVAEHLKPVDGNKTAYQLDNESIPVESVTEQGRQWRVKMNLAGQKTTARDLVMRGKDLLRSIVGPDVQAQDETMQKRPSPILSGLVDNAWSGELTTVEGDNLIVLVDWRAPRTADDDTAIVPERAGATLIVSKRWE